MFCPNCGMQNPETATTCQKCGFAMKTAAPKFKGTMLMMNQPGANPAGPSPAIPPTTGGVAPGSNPQPNSGPSFAAEAPPMGGSGVPSQAGVAGAVGANAPPSRLKGTIVGVAPPKAGAAPGAGMGAPPPAGAPGTQAMPGGMGAPPGAQFGQPGVNALGSTVAVGDNGLPPGFQIPDGPGAPPPAAGAPPPDFGAPPQAGAYGAPPGAAPPPDFGGGAPPPGQYGAPPGGPPPGQFGAPQPDYGQGAPPGGFGAPPPGVQPGMQPGMGAPPGQFGMQQYPGAPMMGPGGGPMMNPGDGKSWLVTLLLCIFGGYFGAHRFYTGHYLFGAIQFFTCGGLYVWWLIDVIYILTGKYTDAQGRPLVKG